MLEAKAGKLCGEKWLVDSILRRGSIAQGARRARRKRDAWILSRCLDILTSWCLGVSVFLDSGRRSEVEVEVEVEMEKMVVDRGKRDETETDT